MTTATSIDTKVRLNNGIEMPIFGLGTFQAERGRETRKAVLDAFDAGYRLVDTAAMYGNEVDVGKAIHESGIPREEIFVTTKLRNDDHGYDRAVAAFEDSLEKLGLSYVDLYLIHFPVEGLRNESWRALETLQEEGKCKSIGISNYMIWHLEELLDSSSTVPVVNQVEFHPFLYQKDLLEFCHSHDIRLEAYSPLTKGHRLGDPRLVEISSRYSKSTAQILIRWALQKDVIVIPKSSRRDRIYENADVFDFEISQEDMEALDSLDENLRTSWDPSTVP